MREGFVGTGRAKAAVLASFPGSCLGSAITSSALRNLSGRFCTSAPNLNIFEAECGGDRGESAPPDDRRPPPDDRGRSVAEVERCIAEGNDYDIVYDFLVLSTITKKKGKVYKDNPQDSSLRNQYFRM